MADSAILAEGLVKHFSKTVALDGIDLSVDAGSVCAVLGRNGAGKTTAVRILTTLIRPDAGGARVAGFDVLREPAKVRARIGLTGQSSTMDELLNGRDNLEIIGRLFHLRPRVAKARADEMLERFLLTEASSRLVKTYSGGMRRRLDLAASLLISPEVLFLDEPTAGLDPIARIEMWRAVRDLVSGGTTVLLTTQYLEEADQLADSIIVIDGGRVRANGTPSELKELVGEAGLRLIAANLADTAALGRLVESVLGVRAIITGREITAPAREGVTSLGTVLSEARRRGIEIEDAGMHRPSLDQVFAHLTRRRPRPSLAGTSPAADSKVS
jgi:ABC-2 type transport system ATP-binding protein